MVLWPDEWEVRGELGEELRRGEASPARRPPAPRVAPPDAGAAGAEERLDFHGLTIAVRCAPSIAERLRRDLAYFRSPPQGAPPDATLDVHVGEPPWDWVPVLPAVRCTERSVSFSDGTAAYVEFFAGALAIVEHGARRGDVFARDAGLAHDVARRLVIALAARSFEARGLHPIDALAVSDRGCGVLVLLPPGCDRRALALDLLARPGLFLLGDDAPLVDRRGRVLPFPLRAGDFAGCRARLGDVAPARALLVGARSSGTGTSIAPTSKPLALRALVKHLHRAGARLDDAPEMLLAHGARQAMDRAGGAASRLASALRVLARARPYRFVLGRDERANRRALHAFLDGIAPA